MSHNPTIPLACNLAALSQEERAAHAQHSQRLFERVINTIELPNGYAFHFAQEADTLLDIATFVESERRCCPFFTFVIQVQAADGPLWLHLVGDQGVKEFIQAQFLNQE